MAVKHGCTFTGFSSHLLKLSSKKSKSCSGFTDVSFSGQSATIAADRKDRSAKEYLLLLRYQSDIWQTITVIFFIFVWSDWYIGVMEMSSDNMSIEDMTLQWRCELLNFDEQNVKGGSSLDPWNGPPPPPPPPPTLLPSCMSRYFPISASAEKRLLSFSLCNCKTQPSNRPFWMSGPIFLCLSFFVVPHK